MVKLYFTFISVVKLFTAKHPLMFSVIVGNIFSTKPGSGRILPDPDPTKDPAGSGSQPDPVTLDPAGSRSKLDPQNLPDIRPDPDPDLDPVHPYLCSILCSLEAGVY